MKNDNDSIPVQITEPTFSSITIIDDQIVTGPEFTLDAWKGKIKARLENDTSDRIICLQSKVWEG